MRSAAGALIAAVHRHDAGAAQPQVVLQRDPRVLDLARLGLAAQVPDQLGALRAAAGAARRAGFERVLLMRGTGGPPAEGGAGDPSPARGCAPGAGGTDADEP